MFNKPYDLLSAVLVLVNVQTDLRFSGGGARLGGFTVSAHTPCRQPVARVRLTPS
jgi:hypothetical protein